MKILSASVLLASVAVMFLTGCTAFTPGNLGGTQGYLFTQVDGSTVNGYPTGQTSSTSKVGRSDSTGVIFFATGDSSVQKAMQNGGITKIHHVDANVTSVLGGLFTKYTTVVYGE